MNTHPSNSFSSSVIAIMNNEISDFHCLPFQSQLTFASLEKNKDQQQQTKQSEHKPTSKQTSRSTSSSHVQTGTSKQASTTKTCRITFKFGALSNRSCFTKHKHCKRHPRRSATLVHAHMVKSKPLKIACSRNFVNKLSAKGTPHEKDSATLLSKATTENDRFKIKCFNSVIRGFHRHCLVLIKQTHPFEIHTKASNC